MRKLLEMAAAATLGLAQAASAKPALLIVGTPHFANAGRHVVATQVPDILIPQRQREIEDIVARLAAFRPSRVAVEWPAAEQERLDRRYADYRAGRYVLSANEIDQIGLRLAARLNLHRVDAVDWGEEPPGGWSHYNYPAWADANGQGPAWRAWVARQQVGVDADVRLMTCTPISSWLRRMNSPAYRLADHRSYYRIAQVGDRVGANPGAAWVGTWHTRNLRILNNLRAVATRPDDRVAVIYGAGHGYLLEQQARESDEFEIADSLRHLPRSPRDAWTRCPS